MPTAVAAALSPRAAVFAVTGSQVTESVRRARHGDSMMHKSDDPTPRDCDEYIAALVAFDGDSQAALFAHCASLSVNAVHEPWNRSPRRLAAAVQVPAPSLML